MLQIVVARLFKGSDTPKYAFTDPRTGAENFATLIRKHNVIVSGLPEDQRENTFFSLAHHVGASEALRPETAIRMPIRTAQTFEYQNVIPFDLDKCDPSRFGEYRAVMADVLGLPPEGFVIVDSGYGLHFYVQLKSPIRDVAYFEKDGDNKRAYNEICKKIEAGCKKLDLPLFKADPVIFEPARIMRLPGSINAKPGREKRPCTLLQNSNAAFDLDLWAVSGLKDRAKENLSPEEMRRKYPEPDFQEMINECRFFQWAFNNPGEVHEPEAFDLFSLLRACKADSEATTGGTVYNPETLAQAIFNLAVNSKSLEATNFEDKWEAAKDFGRKCSTINDRWGKCESCPHWQKIPTPLALKSAKHVGSATIGYWEYDAKGNFKNPAYEDLTKVFKKESHYVVGPNSRILTFKGSHYTEQKDLYLKGWIERKMVPSEPLRESHCMEFLGKLKRVVAGSEEEYVQLFTKNPLGKINALNGTIDVLTGKFMPHSPDHGFRYVLPYAVNLDDDDCSEFLDWLGKITEGREALQDSILDMMAYCLWPTYDDHVFAYLIGDGANGKSTLLHIIQAMVGPGNYSTAGIFQLTGNRFAPAQLDGKLVNLSEESSGSGKDLDLQAMNVLKLLSSGGTMLAEHKGQPGFTFTNQAKLIFSANKVPTFPETGHALTRRMLVIPFDHRITDPDSGVEDRLIAQVPKIVAMLVKRTSAIVQAHGRFQVSRGGYEAAKAQEKILLAHNTAVMWAKENLELGEMGWHVGVNECYDHYKVWCDGGGFPAQNKNNFGKNICSHVLLKGMNESIFKKIAGKSVRVYSGVRFKQEEVYEEKKESSIEAL